MTCDEFAKLIEPWLAGQLPSALARAVEIHASTCVSCYARLESQTRLPAVPDRIAPPPALRARTLAAVARHRVIGRVRRAGLGIAAIASLVLIALMTRPATKSASDFPGAVKSLTAMKHAKPAFETLEQAETELTRALHDDPGNQELVSAIARVERQKDELSRMVREAGS